MTPRATPSAELAPAVDAYVASRRDDLRFPRVIEAPYQEARRRYRASAMRGGILPAILFYNAFLPGHVLLLPETMWVAFALHLLVTACIAGMGLVLRAEPSMLVHEIVGVSIPAAIIGQILLIYMLNGGDAAGDYQFLAIMVVVYMNVNVRPDFRFALGASVALGIAYGCTLFLFGTAPMSGKIVGIASMAAAIYLTLAANWRMERDARHAFVRRLQDQLHRAEAEVAAGRDTLTGLFNRRLLDERITQLWETAHDGSMAAVIMLDVDRFKAFNDRYGHPAGDLCLKRVAGAIQSELRGDADLAARYGGEEFLVVLGQADLATATMTAERIRLAVEELAIPHDKAGSLGRVTVSAGAMAGPPTLHSAAELIAGADAALYAAKRNGRNQVWPPGTGRPPIATDASELARPRVVA